MAPDQAGSDAAARRIDVAPHRLSRWIESFAERHGAVSAESDGATVTFLAADGSVALCQVPFPPLAVEAPAGEPVPVGGTGPAGLAERIAAHAMADRTVGVLLVRLGGYAAGVFTGTEPALAASKVGSRLVHGRSAAGGTSQRRFARRRENQAHQALAAAADTAAAVFGPYAGRLDAVVLGGDRRSIAGIRDDARLAPYFALAVDAFLTVPDPRLAVLAGTPRLFRAVRITLTEHSPDRSQNP
ncbi:MAG TPA: acVLRF1 family peptidyl-tRNA hydrolase [Streptosporangiaceae bacterium]|nr:acVLRF1 family peptidyl-tRNA hydrolase [Streptosporangiaceae bacterium]